MLKVSWLIVGVLLRQINTQTYYSYNASSNNIVNVCHCDVTSGFCDYNCCCDADCGDEVKNALKNNLQACSTNNQQSYCFDASYYAKINVKPSSTSTSGKLTCYNYDPTTVQGEVNISDSQMEEIVKSTLPTATPGYATGYTIYTPVLTINTKLVNSDGTCVNTATTDLTNINFGQNLTIKCTSSSSNIVLFTSVLGKTVSQFLGRSANRQIPSQTSSGILSTLTVLFYYNILGVSTISVPYIVGIRNLEDSSSTAPSIYTLKIRFIDLSVQLKALPQITSPGFFPQIPPDMFYPIFYSWASRLVLAASFAIWMC